MKKELINKFLQIFKKKKPQFSDCKVAALTLVLEHYRHALPFEEMSIIVCRPEINNTPVDSIYKITIAQFSKEDFVDHIERGQE